MTPPRPTLPQHPPPVDDNSGSTSARPQPVTPPRPALARHPPPGDGIFGSVVARPQPVTPPRRHLLLHRRSTSSDAPPALADVSSLSSPKFFLVLRHRSFHQLLPHQRPLVVHPQLQKHKCREKGLQTNCPICCDFLFTSRTAVRALPCGHFMHSACFQAYTCSHYTCPICCKSLGDMAVYFGTLDALLAAEELPEEYRDRCQVFQFFCYWFSFFSTAAVFIFCCVIHPGYTL